MVEELRVRGYEVSSVRVPVHEGFAPTLSICRDDDELGTISALRRDQFAADLAHHRRGRSLSWGGLSGREAAELGSSTRWWPLNNHSTCVGTCPCCSQSSIAFSGSSRWDGQRSVKGAMQTNHTMNYHHHHHHHHPPQNQRPHLRGENSHACRSCGAINSPCKSCSHSHFSSPVNYEAPPPPAASSKQRRARRIGLARARPLPPFPSAHGAPYVLCQHCFLLLLIPAHALPPSRPPGTLPPSCFTLKCGFCFNLSTFSTRHLYSAPPGAPLGAISPLPSSANDSSESASMPGYGASHGGLQEPAVSEFVFQSNTAIAHKNNGEHSMERQIAEAVSHSNGVREPVPFETSEPTRANVISGYSLELKQHGEAGACLDGDYEHISQAKECETGDSLNGLCEHILDDSIIEVRVCRNAEVMQSHNKGIGDGDGIQSDLHSGIDEEINVMSSVQNWVDSLTPETGYDSDSSLRCSDKCAVECEKHAASHSRSPLHQHFGYKSPTELFDKIVFSEDDEMRTRTGTNSTASSSCSSNYACQRMDSRAARLPSLRVWAGGVVKSDANSPNSEENDAQRSFKRLLKRGLTKGNYLPNSKSRVVVNGQILSSAAIKQAEERAGKLRPGSYWYDCKAGFWGVEGGPCLGILPPLIEVLSYPMSGSCSNGNTQVYVNGRELHLKDLTVLSRRGLSEKAGRAYALGFDGVLVDETTGLEIKHLGKLAPTVERKGKGFGMFAADVVQKGS